MANVIDSRELMERLSELEALERSLDPEQDEEASGNGELDDDEKAELAELRELADNVVDWQYGATLIREDYFTDYARELAEDIGAIDDSHGWPLTYIDWERAADALKQDYTAVEYDGSTYYVRD